MKKEIDIIHNIESIVDEKISKNKLTLENHPILFGFLGTMGAITVFIGMEEIIKQIPFIQDNPYLLILFGVVVLFFTGVLYKILD